MLHGKLAVSWILIISLLAGNVAAEVYKWTDEQGKVHYGDRPPHQQAAEVLDMPKVKSQKTPMISDQERLRRQRKLVDALREERELKEKQKKEAAEKQKKQAAYCSKLHARVLDSERINRFYRYDEQGERQYFSDQDADKLRQKLKDKYASECGA
ncbi:MAG: DUF4124 domain-containing protein [Pseudomonadales bacterium]|nr:DUF4124 domain-containing protein [Pseudomonadales bacterium]